MQPGDFVVHADHGIARFGGIIRRPVDGEDRDYLELRYNLLKLTRSAPVFFEIFDLAGRKVQQGYAGHDLSGSFLRLWDGRKKDGLIAPPGTYIYQIRVESDATTTVRQGVANLVY